ncbi:conserved hypothetical protein [Cupriavidus taiwanensis]|uniref:Transmembrane protein n=2 Tax=Cupriavidus TaxID=106589 RepID=A0A375GN00_9BURK|nr:MULTISPECIES: hypothetical protein [Cupriavidus]MCO4865759.1 hypothetical protein [Cupriavidus sp. WGlv3]SOY74020.1 conserved hypothetical protein [Cupriavidus taiwanensis]SOY74106.1 conserved hypothetical protein [Cupriavidus taiwanensis]SOY77118.1 conserved hypothetical protein [Cupriavidus taiwanensis]SOY77380.1 conserved hypothetical protein [Cupriavidus taiwanensis]
MDMRDIEQLHAHYAQPPLTIDISPAGAPVAHFGYAGVSSTSAAAPASSQFAALRRNQRLLWGIAFVAAAAAMFAIGSSIGKREMRASSDRDQPVQAASETSARATAETSDHEWPRKRDAVSDSEATKSTVAPSPAGAVDGPASGPSATAQPVQPKLERTQAEQPKAEAVKRPAPASPPAAATTLPRTATVVATAKTVPQPPSGAQTRNSATQQTSSPTDIKMF